jgi:hypothetical protein
MDGKVDGIFPLYSRINHSCTPNVHVSINLAKLLFFVHLTVLQASYNPTLGTHTVYAIRDVSVGEEIVVSYVNCAIGVQERAEALEEFGVDCYCSVCRDSAAAHRSEDHRRDIYCSKQILAAYDGESGKAQKLNPRFLPQNPGKALEMAETLVEGLREEGLVGMDLAAAYRYVSKYSLQQGMPSKAKVVALKEAEVEKYCLGDVTGWMEGAGNAASWLKHIEATMEKDGVKMRMCMKRELKETKRMEKKAEKKARRGGR